MGGKRGRSECPPYEVVGITYDGVKILKPAVASENFTPEEVRSVIRKMVEERPLHELQRELGRMKIEANRMSGALIDCINQIEYLHEKFGETGSGNAVIARARDAAGMFPIATLATSKESH